MTRIKICGITNLADALLAVECGADFLGFIGVPASTRYVGVATVDNIRRQLPPHVQTVVVAETLRDGQAYTTDRIQFYDENGIRPPDRNADRRIRVFRIKNAESLRAIRTYPHFAGAYLLDAHSETALGGIGQTFDWNLATEAKRIAGGIPVFLAGGLKPQNVGDAVRLVRPYGVDVSSGVELSPGRKDAEKIRDFVWAVRDADAEARELQELRAAVAQSDGAESTET